MNIKDIETYALSINLKIDDNLAQSILEDFNVISAGMNEITEIKTDGVEPLNFPHEQNCQYLWPDEPAKPLNVKLITNNAPASENNYILVPQVIRNHHEN